jgi:hypothetical protein
VGVCAGITRSGGRCTVSVSGAQQEFCHLHDPARAGVRRRAASKAARARPRREVASLKSELRAGVCAAGPLYCRRPDARVLGAARAGRAGGVGGEGASNDALRRHNPERHAVQAGRYAR